QDIYVPPYAVTATDPEAGAFEKNKGTSNFAVKVQSAFALNKKMRSGKYNSGTPLLLMGEIILR
ncbi:MAG: hypothetical protein J6U50_04365, partial [Lachnospiraceae bacterium]|nr:hypothetical protein [Lachnospiraceae bacterium]